MVPLQPKDACYVKVICDKNKSDLILGMHVLGLRWSLGH